MSEPADDALVARALAQEHARIRGWLHDGALQVLEYLAGGGFGGGASAEETMALAARAALELRHQLERLGAEESSDLLDGLRGVVADARVFAEHDIELVVGPIDSALERAASG